MEIALFFIRSTVTKRALPADLKNASDRGRVLQLLGKADVMIQNFRPGVMEKLGLDYESVRGLNPRLIYGEITGYGTVGPLEGQARPGSPAFNPCRDLRGLMEDADQPPRSFWTGRRRYVRRSSSGSGNPGLPGAQRESPGWAGKWKLVS